jgi:plasmid stability protein
MADVLVRNVPQRVLARLKKRAAANGRSLQAELKQVLTDGAGPDLSKFRRLAAKMRRELAGRVHSDSVDLIREDREG